MSALKDLIKTSVNSRNLDAETKKRLSKLSGRKKCNYMRAFQVDVTKNGFIMSIDGDKYCFSRREDLLAHMLEWLIFPNNNAPPHEESEHFGRKVRDRVRSKGGITHPDHVTTFNEEEFVRDLVDVTSKAAETVISRVEADKQENPKYWSK